MAKGGHVMVWGWPWLVGAPHGTNESSHDLLAPISRHKPGIATHDTMCTTCAICQLLLFGSFYCWVLQPAKRSVW